MSKLIYIAYRKDKGKDKKSRDKSIIKKIESRILPDNLSPNPIKWLETNDSMCAIFNPVSTLKYNDSSVCLGYTPNNNWHELDMPSDQIEGSFAIIRNYHNTLQIVSDMVASRTIWYYFDNDIFIVSTSQRAIVSILGSFELNDNVIPWMLSSGTIGPGFSYDKRINILKPNSILTLDKEKWELTQKRKTITLKNTFSNREEAKNELKKNLHDVFDQFNLDNDKLALPLSGGYDSRGILMLLKNKNNLKTVTWGSKESRQRENNDAYIAKQLADAVGVNNEFYESYDDKTKIDDVFRRFLVCSEGRIDHIGGYLDGMKMWNNFFERGFETIIRGEELIGLSVAKNKFIARREEGITTLKDYYNIPSRIIDNLPEQCFPNMDQKSIYTYKGTLAIEYEHPIVFAALNDIKLPYVEVFSPLLSSSIIKTIATMFDEKIIGDKKLFIEIVEELSPSIKIAKESANKQITDLFSSGEVKREIDKVLKNAISNNSFDKDLVTFTLNKVTNEKIIKKRKTSLTSIIRKHLPKAFYDFLKSNSNKREINWSSFAFRLYILIKMKDMFTEDSKLKI